MTVYPHPEPCAPFIETAATGHAKYGVAYRYGCSCGTRGVIWRETQARCLRDIDSHVCSVYHGPVPLLPTTGPGPREGDVG